MTCSTCYDFCEVLISGHDSNADAFTIGSITDTSTAVLVLIENVGHEGYQVQEVTSDGSGNVTIDLQQSYFDNGQTYRLRVSPKQYGQEFKAITPPSGGSTTYTCMTMTVKRARA